MRKIVWRIYNWLNWLWGRLFSKPEPECRYWYDQCELDKRRALYYFENDDNKEPPCNWVKTS